MTVIKVPKPPVSAYDPNRPVSSLLKMQIEHLSEAEKRLPLRYRSEIYVNAIRTEGEAANYIQSVTEAIHKAHADAGLARHLSNRKRVRQRAVVADHQPEPMGKTKVRKSSGKKSSPKKKKK
jgi:hypothetical protein